MTSRAELRQLRDYGHVSAVLRRPNEDMRFFISAVSYTRNYDSAFP
jgi:hypothetical protein